LSAYSKNAWLAFGLSLAAAGTAYAAIPDANGVIRGCYNVLTGSARIVDSNSCSLFERSISWQQTGPRGPTGPQGEPGPAGPQGPAGDANVLIGWGEFFLPSPGPNEGSVRKYLTESPIFAPNDGQCWVTVSGTQAEFTAQASFRISTLRDDNRVDVYGQTAVAARTETMTGSDFKFIQSATISDVVRLEAGHTYTIGVSLQNEPPTPPTAVRNFGFTLGWHCRFEE
jgi:hypothetical protein